MNDDEDKEWMWGKLKNNSKKFRISLIGRYHNMSTNDFNSGLNVYKYTNKQINKEVYGQQ